LTYFFAEKFGKNWQFWQKSGNFGAKERENVYRKVNHRNIDFQGNRHFDCRKSVEIAEK
jgi:hypothetical protein